VLLLIEIICVFGFSDSGYTLHHIRGKLQKNDAKLTISAKKEKEKLLK
jgi:hypothetical protein